MNKAWRERILRLCVGGMELGALYTLLSLVNFKAADSALSVAGILSIYILSLFFNRLFYHLKLKHRLLYSLNILLWIASLQMVLKLLVFQGMALSDQAFLLAVPRALAGFTSGFKPELVVFFSSILLWGMGYRLARVRIDFVLSLAEFQSGLAVIVFIYSVNAQINAAALNSPLVALTFVALSLIALAVSHAEQASSWLSSRYSTYWLILLVLSIVLIVAIGLTAGSFASRDLLDILLTPVRWLWWLFSRFMLFLAEHTVMEKFLNPLDWEASGGNAEDVDHISRMFEMPIWLRDGLRFIMGVVWFVFIMLALWRISSFIVHWLRSHFVGHTQAEVESLDGAFRDDLLGFLRCIWNRIMSLFSKDTRVGIVPEAELVRQLYREMLSWGASKGVPRSSNETPYEYYYALSAALPLASDELRFITDRYVSTRYGLILPGENELTELRATWQRIRRSGNTHK